MIYYEILKPLTFHAFESNKSDFSELINFDLLWRKVDCQGIKCLPQDLML